MKKLIFPNEEYKEEKGSWIYVKTEESVIGKLELLWLAIEHSELKDLKLRDHKSNKKLKKAIREITRFKDKDEDARIALPGEQSLVLEDAEFELLRRHIDEGNKFGSKVSDDLIALYDILNAPHNIELIK